MSVFDYAAIATYLALILVIGIRAGRDRSSASDLLLGARSMPTWAVFLSMVATELSAATFISVPAFAYTGDWRYLEFAFGALAGKWVVAQWVIPRYHELGLVTVYGVLGNRFGRDTQRNAALAFAIGRVLASGVRLFIAALAFSVVTQLPLESTIVICGVVAVIYTMIGGIGSVIWTDVVQGLVFIVAALVLLVALDTKIDGGLMQIWNWGSETGRTRIFYWEPWLSLNSSTSFATAFVGGFFLTLATHSTDHDMVQRLLTTRDGRSGGRALLASGFFNFPMSALFLFIGSGIAFATLGSPVYESVQSKEILPLFALHELPTGARGLVFAGLFAAAMSSLDSAICSIATTWVVDIRPSPGIKSLEDSIPTRMRRACVGTGCALILAAIAMAMYFRHMEASEGGLSLIEFALSSMTILYGGLLGVFARAIFIDRPGRDDRASLGLALGCLVGLVLFLHPILLGRTLIAWVWWLPISASISVAVSSSGGRPVEAPR